MSASRFPRDIAESSAATYLGSVTAAVAYYILDGAKERWSIFNRGSPTSADWHAERRVWVWTRPSGGIPR